MNLLLCSILSPIPWTTQWSLETRTFPSTSQISRTPRFSSSVSLHTVRQCVSKCNRSMASLVQRGFSLVWRHKVFLHRGCVAAKKLRKAWKKFLTITFSHQQELSKLLHGLHCTGTAFCFRALHKFLLISATTHSYLLYVYSIVTWYWSSFRWLTEPLYPPWPRACATPSTDLNNDDVIVCFTGKGPSGCQQSRLTFQQGHCKWATVAPPYLFWEGLLPTGH